MRKICESGDQKIITKPRWPYDAVFICDDAYFSLVKAQKILDSHEIRLILTRGYENQGRLIRFFHSFARLIGAALFRCLYPKRANEIKEIFSANGHNKNGNSVDLSVMHKGELITLLPYGVFTRESTIKRLHQIYEPILDLVLHALEVAGFKVHSNQTEAMQIHCEFKQSTS